MTQQTLFLLVVAFFGMAAVVAGVSLLAGLGWALITGGLLAISTAVVLVDPNTLRGNQ